MTETWITVQSKTFTKWLNTKLTDKIKDIFVDLRDGVALCALIKELSQQEVVHTSPAITRFQKLENIQNVLSYLTSTKLKLINIGSTDIVDGNTKLTLGLIWTIIKKFAIRDEPGNEKLLKWCKALTAGYNIPLTNFGKCWQDGMAFNAIIHRFRPDLIDYDSLKKSDRMKNLENAFCIAEESLSIPRLIDAEDIAFVISPDEKSVMTYLSLYYDKFGDIKDNKKKLESYLYACNKKKEAETNLELILNAYKRDMLNIEKNNARYKMMMKEIKGMYFENENAIETLKLQKLQVISLQGSINSINNFFGDKNSEFEEMKDIENEIVICEKCGTETNIKHTKNNSFCNENGIERKMSRENDKTNIKHSTNTCNYDYNKCLKVLNESISIENQILGLEKLNLETKSSEVKKIIEDKILLFSSLINKKDTKKMFLDAQEMFENICDKINKSIKKEEAVQILKILGIYDSKNEDLFRKKNICLEEFLIIVKQCHNESFEINKIKAELARMSKDGRFVSAREVNKD